MSDEQTQPTQQATLLPAVREQSRAMIARTEQGMVLSTFEDAWRFSTMLAKSDLVPKDYKDKPENVMVAIQMGAEIGLPPMQAIQNIAVINGRPSLWGDVALALVQGKSSYEWHKEFFEGEGDKRVAVFQIKRKGQDMYEVRFSYSDAKTAGLTGKTGPWTNYPNRMLQMRARSWGLRDKFADVLRGLSVAEEAMDATPIIVSQSTEQNTLPAHDPQGDIKERADALLKEKQPQHNAAQRIVIMRRFDGHLQDLIDSLNSNSPAQSTGASFEKEDKVPESKPEVQSSPSATSVRETEKAAASGDAPNVHGVTITDHDLEGIGDQQDVKKGSTVESKRTQNATRKPSSGSFGF
jgi:hypothetical protein